MAKRTLLGRTREFFLEVEGSKLLIGLLLENYSGNYYAVRFDRQAGKLIQRFWDQGKDQEANQIEDKVCQEAALLVGNAIGVSHERLTTEIENDLEYVYVRLEYEPDPAA